MGDKELSIIYTPTPPVGLGYHSSVLVYLFFSLVLVFSHL